MNQKLVQRYLGHSDVTTTLRYYVDSLPRQRRGVSGRFTGQQAVVWLPIAKARGSGRGAGGKVKKL